MMCQAFHKAGLPKGVLNVATGEHNLSFAISWLLPGLRTLPDVPQILTTPQNVMTH